MSVSQMSVPAAQGHDGLAARHILERPDAHQCGRERRFVERFRVHRRALRGRQVEPVRLISGTDRQQRCPGQVAALRNGGLLTEALLDAVSLAAVGPGAWRAIVALKQPGKRRMARQPLIRQAAAPRTTAVSGIPPSERVRDARESRSTGRRRAAIRIVHPILRPMMRQP